MSSSREAYEEKIKARNQTNAAPAPAAEPSFQENAAKVGGQIASNQAQQGNLAGTIGGAAMMTGNPYAMAGGLALQVYAAGEQNKLAAEEAQRLAYNERVAKRQEQMNNLARMGIK